MIHLINGNSLLSVLPSPSRSGINPIFRAKLLVNGASVMCFVKPVPDRIFIGPGQAVDNREIINETIGYVLARDCGFNVPAVAGLIVLNRSQLPPPVLAKADKDTAGELQDSFIAWFTEDMRYPDLVVQHTGGDAAKELCDRVAARISRELIGKDELPNLVSFDDWTLNSDRNPGNVLSAGMNSLALIDHGRIFESEAWHYSELEGLARHMTENQMLLWAEVADPSWSKKLPNQSRRELAYNGFGKSFRQSGHVQIQDTLRKLALPGDEIDAIINLLDSRLDMDNYRKAIGLLA